MNRWDNIQDLLPPGSKCVGAVVAITEYGCFIEVLPGIEGLLRTGPDGNPHRRFHVGDRAEVVVLEVEPGNQKMSLGLVERPSHSDV